MDLTTTRESCTHCGAAVVAPANAPGPHYCCAGCEAVAELLRENGWERFYAKREGFSPRPTGADTEAFDGDAYQDAFVRVADDGTHEARFRVGGIRCAACVWLNERALSETAGVVSAHVSYGTGIATLTYDPTRVQLSRLAAVVSGLGYTPLEPRGVPRADRQELTRVGVAAFCAMNVMSIHIAIYLGDASGMDHRYSVLFGWASLVLATPAMLYSAVPFFTGSMQALRRRMLSMDVPIAIALGVMYVHGLAATWFGQPSYLDSLTMLIAFLLGGRVLVSHGRNRAAAAAEAVLATAPRSAHLRDGERVREVSVGALQAGDIIVAGAGERVGADVRVVSGRGFADLSHVSGEARPVEVTAGAELPAGAALVSGQVDAEVLRPAAESTVARIERLVRAALDARAPTRTQVDRLAPWFTFGVLAIAAVAGASWWFVAGADVALRVVVAVLVVACPCALALAAPTTFAVGIGAAARRGAFVRSGEALLQLADVDKLAFDKTGTLTAGVPRVVDAADRTLCLAAPLEVGNRHPVARAIVAELERRGLPFHRGTDVMPVAGGGVRGSVAGQRVAVLPSGPGEVLVAVDDVREGTIRLEDVVRRDARATLRALGLPVTILSGDHPESVRRVADAVGVADAHGSMLPEDKTAWVGAHVAAGSRVLFAGDGLNDAPALASAYVAVAMGDGSEAAIQSADVVVLESALAPIAAAVEIGRLVARVLRANARFAVGYNTFAVALACAGYVTPLVAALLMPLSSLVVILNALGIEWRMQARERARRGGSAAPTPAFEPATAEA